MAKPLTDEDIAYMLAHKDDSLVANIYACSIATGVASVFVLLIRVWARYVAHGRIVLNTSDWLMTIAWIAYIGALVSFSLSAIYGLGKHIIFVTDARQLRIWGIILEVFYYVCIGFIKFSILSFYGAIFSSKRFQISLWIVGAFVAAWSISSTVVSIFQCTPIEFAWDTSIPGGFCINYGVLVLVAGVINVITDFVILALPIPMILRLQVTKQKRFQLVFIFATGSSACIVSIIRLAYSLVVSSTADVSWDNVPPGFVSAAELLVGILAASIPTYGPLFRRYIAGTTVRSSQRYGRSKGQISSQLHSASISVSGAGAINGPGVHITDEVELTRHELRNGAWVRIED
ncbi:hypothetical protein K445DRAFT_307757 [Daldinia sp. EC12]|nr:hypothetical protein F4774DRAFT_387286 [Daldinia eschscholtzii]OTB18912.1 hypothetical protein K445DRAFT_307757 [Daldinia sp. EC12]